MADIGKAIRLRLLNDGDVTDNVGTRIYPRVVPQGVANPCVRYQTISSFRDGALDGGTGMVTATVQVDVFADTHLAAELVSEKIRESLQGFRGTASGVEVLGCTLTNSREMYTKPVDASDDGDYRVVMDFEVVHQEPIPTH